MSNYREMKAVVDPVGQSREWGLNLDLKEIFSIHQLSLIAQDISRRIEGSAGVSVFPKSLSNMIIKFMTNLENASAARLLAVAFGDPKSDEFDMDLISAELKTSMLNRAETVQDEAVKLQEWFMKHLNVLLLQIAKLELERDKLLAKQEKIAEVRINAQESKPHQLVAGEVTKIRNGASRRSRQLEERMRQVDGLLETMYSAVTRALSPLTNILLPTVENLTPVELATPA